MTGATCRVQEKSYRKHNNENEQLRCITIAIVKNNHAIEGLSGILGGILVSRVVGNKTIVAVAPRRRRVISAKQLAQQERFREAVAIARYRLRDTVYKVECIAKAAQGTMLTALNVAVANYMNNTTQRILNTEDTIVPDANNGKRESDPEPTPRLGK